MLTENHIHTLNDLLMEQGEQLLAAQKMVASVYYLGFDSGGVYMGGGNRANEYTVRCVQE